LLPLFKAVAAMNNPQCAEFSLPKEIRYSPKEWPELIAFDNICGPDIDAAHLPEPFASFAHALSVETETPEAMTVMTILGILGLILSRKMRIQVNSNYSEPVNLYIMIVLKSGNRKSQILKVCVNPLVQWEKEQCKNLADEIRQKKSRRSTMEKTIEKMRKDAASANDENERRCIQDKIERLESELPEIPVLPQLYATDSTPEAIIKKLVEQKNVFGIVSDEGGILDVLSGLYSNGNANIDVILQGIDGGSVRVDRCKNEDPVILNPLLSFVLSAQPSVIEKMASKKAFSGRGVPQRFLYILPESFLGRRTLDTPPMSEHIRKNYEEAVYGLINSITTAPDNITFTLSMDAHAVWQEFRHYIEKMLGVGGALSGEETTGWGGKIPGFVLRIAAIIHAATHGIHATVIDKASMEKTVNLSGLLIEHALVAFSKMSGVGCNTDARNVWDFICRQNCDSIGREQLTLGLKNCTYGRAEKLNVCITELIKRGYIKEVRQATAGRTATVYQVNPKACGGKDAAANDEL